ncbi:hypothetical protein Rhopal_003664-T1 [Rhodotorula paludigena]|uniref:GH16 domain-containing protein n=1 Tax=Rhodotorula paludigena TaxID=86838 RepID=A0AAV5GNR5_9BASI|nr:hypothetical protein Rhopal_003664-T1 [Rhodotorula paludigena]
MLSSSLVVVPLLAAALVAQPAAAYPPAASDPVYIALVNNEETLVVKKRDLVDLEDRATVRCAATTDCSKAAYAIPPNSHYACNKARATCTWSCARSATTTPASPAGPKAPAATPVLKRTYAGATFFDQFNFWSKPDPTHGQVNYLTREAATRQGLVSVSKAGTAVLQIDRSSKLVLGAKRDSVRIESKEVYQPGNLIILDMKHAPWGPSVWPAFWLYNYPWPQSGEVDIYEGVNSRTFNQATLHTVPGCTRSGAQTGNSAASSPSCDAYGPTWGCSSFDYDQTSYGDGFNRAGGGVFAVLFAETGISMWRFPRARIPADIKSGAPRWKSWGTPFAAFDGSTCDTRTYFKNQMLTFDITTCGDWAGQDGVWRDPSLSGPVYPRYANCAAAVADPAAMKEAYFEVNYLKVFSV